MKSALAYVAVHLLALGISANTSAVLPDTNPEHAFRHGPLQAREPSPRQNISIPDQNQDDDGGQGRDQHQTQNRQPFAGVIANLERQWLVAYRQFTTVRDEFFDVATHLANLSPEDYFTDPPPEAVRALRLQHYSLLAELDRLEDRMAVLSERLGHLRQVNQKRDVAAEATLKVEDRLIHSR